MASVRQLKPTPGKYVYELRVTDSGRSLSRRFTVPSSYSKARAQREAESAAAVLEADFKAGKVLTRAERKAQAEQALREAAAMPAFQAYADEWLKSIATSRAANTLKNYTIVLERAGKVFNGYKLDEITPYMIRQYLNRLETEEGLSWTTCGIDYAALRCFFQSAEDNGIIDLSPMVKVKRPRRSKDDTRKGPDVFTADEASHILECMKQEPLKWQALVAFMLDSGCRRGECVALMWNELDFSMGKVTISRGAVCVSGQGVKVSSTKTGRTREFLISPQTLTVLKKWKQEQAIYNLAHGIPSSGYCFTGDTGDMMHPESITRQFRVLKKRYNLPGFHPHALRHTMVSIGITSGADVVSISKRARHANPSITLNVYSHASEEAQRRASEIIADAIYKKA